MSAEPATATKEESASFSGPKETTVANRYRLAPEARLPELDMAGGEAYVVHDDRAPGEVLFARVLAADAQPRLMVMNNLRHMREVKVLQPLDWGPVRLPGSREQRLAIVFRKPDNPALMQSWKATIPALSADDIARRVLAPAVLALTFLRHRGLTHRALRPENIYWESGSKSSVLLGDCVSAAAGSTQPVIFEPIESAMTPPVARGDGWMPDDFYALGVTLLILSMGRCPIARLTDEQIVAAKLQKGSYTGLMNGERPPFGLRELLRGLLSDDPAERWGLDELEQWLSGGLRSSVQEVRKPLADRPFGFAGREYANVRALADAFGRNWKDAAKAIRTGELVKWLRRGAGAADIAEDIAGLVRNQPGVREGDSDAMLVTHVCMLLDRTGPLRYKGLIAMPAAFGSLLASAFHTGDRERINLVAECIAKGVALDWFVNQPVRTQHLLETQMKELKSAQQLLRHTGPGYGIERLLYHLNQATQCRSVLLGGTYLEHIRDLMAALDRVVEQRGGLDPLIDRHLIAFIAARIRGQIDRVLSRIEASKGDPLEMKLGLLRLFAALQQTYGPEELPFLTQWLTAELEPATQRIKGRSMREELRKRLVAVGNGGSLVQLNAYLNNETMLRRDEGGRRLAQKEFAVAAREISQLESREFQESAQRLGWRIASGISGTVSAAALALVVLA